MNLGDPIDFTHPGGIIDITNIPSRLSGMGTLSIEISIALLGFFCACEIARQNVKAIEGNTNYTSAFVRVGIVIIMLVCYNGIFNFPIKLIAAIESAVLTPDDFNSAVQKISDIGLAKESVTILSTVSVLTAWFASYAARLLTGVLQTVQFIFLAMLYFFGPMMLVASVLEPLKSQVETWLKGIVDVALWTLLIRVLLRIMIEIGIFASMTQTDHNSSLLQFTIVNIAFVIMMFCSPILAHRFIGGPNFGSVATIVTTLVTSRAMSLVTNGVNAVGGSVGGGVGIGAAAAAGAGSDGIKEGIEGALQRFFGTKGSKTNMRDVREQSRMPQNPASNSSTPAAPETIVKPKRGRS